MPNPRQARVEPAPGQESVWDYPRPPRLEPTAKRIQIVFAGVTIADTSAAWRVLETSHPPTYYLPPDDVRTDLLVRSQRASFCEWKGQAAYWSVVVGERRADDVAFSYPTPTPSFEPIRDYIAFYPAPMDECRVDGQQVTPQTGGFYAGWITADIVGPFKGEPGTMGW